MAPKDAVNREAEVRTEEMGRRRGGNEDEKILPAEFMVKSENSKGKNIPNPKSQPHAKAEASSTSGTAQRGGR